VHEHDRGATVRGGDGFGEDEHVLVVKDVPVDATLGRKLHWAQSMPRGEVARHGECGAGAAGAVGAVAHHVGVEGRHEGDARVFDAAGGQRVLLVPLGGLERDAEALDAARIAVAIELDTGEADARVIVDGHDAREEQQLALAGAGDGGVEHPPCLGGVVLVAAHQHAKALQGDLVCGWRSVRHVGLSGLIASGTGN